MKIPLSTITIKRMWVTSKSTISTFSISGSELSGFILERPGPDTIKANLRLRVPAGQYRLKWHNSTRRSIAKYNPLPLLYNEKVPASRYILIHNGNEARDSDGCLLIGSSRAEDKVQASVPKLIKLKKYLDEVGIENVKIEIKNCF